ncbi:MAG: helix-turn-helix domain-containing protein [Sphingopyxis terrae]|nr:helix-turn-helix domain-containing protein [Sphingopyxis terrae]
MQATMECTEFFRTQLSPEKPDSEADAIAAMMVAGRESRWQRSEACDAVIARGAVACVLAGAVRKFALRPNGQRQIIDIVFAGDYVGFAPADPAFFLEAVSDDTRIVSFTRKQIDGLTARFPAVAALMQNGTRDMIRRLEHHLLVQTRITAREKVGAYLAAMSRRVKPSGTNAIVLPITRYDIADHLGIAVETVSRTMTLLCRRGSIALKTPRDVEIRDPSMLADS